MLRQASEAHQGFSSRADLIFGCTGKLRRFEGASESTNLHLGRSAKTECFALARRLIAVMKMKRQRRWISRQKDILPESMQELEGRCLTHAYLWHEQNQDLNQAKSLSLPTPSFPDRQSRQSGVH